MTFHHLAFLAACLGIIIFGFIAGNIHGYAHGWSDAVQRRDLAESDWPYHERKVYGLRSTEP